MGIDWDVLGFVGFIGNCGELWGFNDDFMGFIYGSMVKIRFRMDVIYDILLSFMMVG